MKRGMNTFLKVVCAIDNYFDAYDDPESDRASGRGMLVLALAWVANLISVVLLLSPGTFRIIAAHRNAAVGCTAILSGFLALPMVKAMAKQKALLAADLDALETLRRYRLLAFLYVVLSLALCIGLFLAGRASP